MTRRDAARVGLFSLAARPSPAAIQPRWTREWDQALLQSVLAEQHRQFDPVEKMLAADANPELGHHANVLGRKVHPTRESLAYALLLLESGPDSRRRRAEAVLDRCLALQDTNPESPSHGLWGYYLEEPASKISPADFNSADFNGSLLLMIEARHGRRLPSGLRSRIRESIRAAAASVRKRNISMHSTSIAVLGTFVVLAAAELLVDPGLLGYALDRLRRFCAAIEETASFAEYNSPAYTRDTIANLTRMRMFCRDTEALARVDRLHDRAWLHLVHRWHAPTRQFAGPMSRCHSTDLGKPLWLQKALDGQLEFATLEDVRRTRATGAAETAILEYRCPRNIQPLFLDPKLPHQHREMFVAAKDSVPAVHGTTWLTGRFSIGSASRSDFWVQRRPLLAYWGDARSNGYMRVRLVKDDSDFASGLLYSVQQKGFVLAMATFCLGGGDSHITLDPIRDGQFTCKRLRLRCDLAGIDPKAKILANGKAAGPGSRVPEATRVSIDLGGATISLGFQSRLPVSIDREGEFLTISQDFHSSAESGPVRWTDLKQRYAALTVAIAGPERSLVRFDQDVLQSPFGDSGAGPGVRRLSWRTPAADLLLEASSEVRPINEQNARFRDLVNGRPVPLVRLSDEPLS
jgi:hypothetical protein